MAFRISSTKGAFYNCKFFGFQDTLCDDVGYHFYMDCRIEGTVDFVFGDGTSLFIVRIFKFIMHACSIIYVYISVEIDGDE